MLKLKKVGTRKEVLKGLALQTGGGLTKNKLMKNKHGKIVSIKASASAKNSNNLVRAGFLTEKGKFGYVFEKP